ncbi:MAG TPA: maleylpyruvate isomerase N-terminal domain-containing protein [Propionicimonas sp.]|uniref:maleylpyruvate isomerase N-terminal domain-containing protein n=1 Tax=Propionicimonas sp. TaxID=1955623 RepID=UPI002F416201
MTLASSAHGDWENRLAAFVDATRWYQEVLAQVGDRWSAPALGEWDVRALAGHTSRSLLTVEAYLGHPAAAVDVDSTVDYYVATRQIAAGPDVAQRGRDAGQALGDDPVAAVAKIASRVLPLVAGLTGTELLTTIAGGMRLGDYLPTRVFELVVHTADLAVALGVAAEPPPVPAALALQLVSDLAIAGGHAATVLLATTGRGGLPSGFTLL